MRYDWCLPAKVAFGWGRLADLGGLCRPLGRRALLLYAPAAERNGHAAAARQSLRAAGIAVEPVGLGRREPDIAAIDFLAAAARSMGPGEGDFIVALGGGSTLDAGKAVAALALEPSGSVRGYLEGVGDGRVPAAALPVVAIPTTAGTGSEATRNAVVAGPQGPGGFKKSFRHDLLMPRLALVDPELTVTCPAEPTLHSGLDAITQLLESALSLRRHPALAAMAESALDGLAAMLERALADPADREARTAMAHGAFVSGVCLANGGLGMAHGVAAGLGALFGVPHGLACAVMLPTALEVNLPVRGDDIARLGGVLLGRNGLDGAGAAAAVRELVQVRLGVPSRLEALGVSPGRIPELAAASLGSSLSGNPVPLDAARLEGILRRMG